MTSGKDTREHDDTWRRIESMLDRVAELSACDVTEVEFYNTLLREASLAGAALGGAVWIADPADPAGPLRLLTQHCADHAASVDLPPLDDTRRTLLARVRAGGRAASALVGVNTGDGILPRAAPLPVVACPVTVAGRVVRILEIVQRPDSPPESRTGYEDVLSSFCELAADYHRRIDCRQLPQGDGQWQQLDRFVRQIHRDLHLERTAYTLVNEARRLVECDRVTVAVRQGGGHRVCAISGLETFDRRAEPVRLLQHLSERVAAVGEPVWYNGQTAQLPPELEAAVAQYVDVSHSRTVTAVPLPADDQRGNAADDALPVGVLIFESFDSRPSHDAYRQSVLAVCRHAAGALQNAVRYQRLPAVWLLERLGGLAATRTWIRLLCWTAPVLLLLAVLVFFPADFYIRSDGRLQPQQRRRVFAPRDGQVDRVHVQHGEFIAAETVVAQMRSSELELETTRVLGELQTMTKRYDAIRASRLGANPTGAMERDEYARLTAEEERLGKLLANLEEQRRLLQSQQEQLQVRSPIAGQVVTWDVASQLQQRPVRRGQLLLTVADVRGPWVLELQVPDRYVHHVLQAREDVRQDLEVVFMLATGPQQSYQGRLLRLAAATEPDESLQLSATAWVSVDRDAVTDLRPGAGVTARIYCGRRAVGYVWLHDLIATVRAWLFL
jgi:multidrug efflux pump subunit AcrA (membrane-fusion protein)